MFNELFNPELMMLETVANFSTLKKSARFNEFMYKHYGALFRNARKKWRFMTAAMLWIRMAKYERAMLEAKLCEMNESFNLPAVCKN